MVGCSRRRKSTVLYVLLLKEPGDWSNGLTFPSKSGLLLLLLLQNKPAAGKDSSLSPRNYRGEAGLGGFNLNNRRAMEVDVFPLAVLLVPDASLFDSAS